MKRRRTQLVGISCLVTLAIACGLEAQESGEKGASVREGVYTEEQARDGRAVFAENCSYCHAPRQFSGRTWLNRWSGSAVASFFELVRNTMPFDGPGRLSPRQYTEIVAYVLEMNGFPAGDERLPADREALSRIRIEAPEEAGAEGT